MVSKAWDQVRYGWEDWFQDEVLGIPSEAIQIKAANLRDERNARKRKGTKVTTDIPLPGTASRYNKDGSKKDLGVGFGEPSSVKADLEVIKAGKNNKLGDGSSIGETNARASWLKATANSPAAKAGFSDDERWNLQQQHREWKANRSGTTSSESTITTETNTELPKQETKNSGLDPNKLISEGGSKKGPWMTLPDGSINPEFQKAYPQSTEAKIDLIDQGLKTDGQGNLVPWFEGERLGIRIPFSSDTSTPLQRWQAQQHQQLQQQQQQQTQSNKVTAADRMEGAGKSMAIAAVKAVMEKMFAPKEGDEGANTSEGALSGGNAWEQFYTGTEFASLPAWYM